MSAARRLRTVQPAHTICNRGFCKELLLITIKLFIPCGVLLSPKHGTPYPLKCGTGVVHPWGLFHKPSKMSCLGNKMKCVRQGWRNATFNHIPNYNNIQKKTSKWGSLQLSCWGGGGQEGFKYHQIGHTVFPTYFGKKKTWNWKKMKLCGAILSLFCRVCNFGKWRKSPTIGITVIKTGI